MLFPPITVTYTNGEKKTYDVKPIDSVIFERKYGSMAIFANDPHIEHLYYLAYLCDKRVKQSGVEFETWLETIENAEAGELNPTPAAPEAASPDGSANSPHT
jgi:hypothetical protein